MKNVIYLYCVFIVIAIIVTISGCNTKLEVQECAFCDGEISWHMHETSTLYAREYHLENGNFYHPWCYKLKGLANEQIKTP